ncbi:hypothetical protein [Dokdonia pacifica]|uniref:SMI1/KNR4 family protein n=1 Tax=Dokdonia pacifica TaxID=1627892 RepID=A0A239C9B8_9FLAO|nr:hypothetical protein [Dokdonia pacifica]GGG26319.1 hypothetical protein GCM10011344_28780 [Dokdonia pacifica]SNS16044.1 hypothetical protein SAMN06265376_107165 [Dokdonia pacifica]
MKHRFNKYLEYYLIEVENEEKIESLNFEIPNNLESKLPQLTALDKVHFGIEDFYENACNGYDIEWRRDSESEVGGRMRLNDTEFMFNAPYEPDEYIVSLNPELADFRDFDLCTDESQVGFLINKEDNTISKYLYYHISGDPDLHLLDLNFSGYTQMAVEARVFYGWQRILLHYDGWEYGKEETKLFKEEMPKLFSDWTWEGFIEKYESLRLSKK